MKRPAHPASPAAPAARAADRPGRPRCLEVRNRQSARRLDLRRWRAVFQAAAAQILSAPDAELCFHLVNNEEMAAVNERYLGHPGTTDVITFNLSAENTAGPLLGEIYLCVDEALRQAKVYQVPWPEELARYAVHGLLHLAGFDDHTPADRRRMRRQEDRVLRQLRGALALTDPSQPRTSLP